MNMMDQIDCANDQNPMIKIEPMFRSRSKPKDHHVDQRDDLNQNVEHDEDQIFFTNNHVNSMKNYQDFMGIVEENDPLTETEGIRFTKVENDEVARPDGNGNIKAILEDKDLNARSRPTETTTDDFVQHQEASENTEYFFVTRTSEPEDTESDPAVYTDYPTDMYTDCPTDAIEVYIDRDCPTDMHQAIDPETYCPTDLEVHYDTPHAAIDLDTYYRPTGEDSGAATFARSPDKIDSEPETYRDPGWIQCADVYPVALIQVTKLPQLIPPQEVVHHFPSEEQEVTDTTHAVNPTDSGKKDDIGDYLATYGCKLSEPASAPRWDTCHHLRPRRKKEKVVVPKKSNAERCRNHRTTEPPTAVKKVRAKRRETVRSGDEELCPVTRLRQRRNLAAEISGPLTTSTKRKLTARQAKKKNEQQQKRLPESPHEVFHHLPNKHQDSTHRVTGTGVTDNTHGEKEGNQDCRTSTGEREGDKIVTNGELCTLSLAPRCDTFHYLRPRRKKEKVVIPKKSNAERCQGYRTYLKKHRPDKFQAYLTSMREYSKAWRASRTQEEWTRDKELSRMRKAKRRERIKLTPVELPVSKTKPKKKKKLTREEKEKKKRRNEKAKLRMRRLRATWPPDKRKEVNEKRMQRYRMLVTKTVGESVMPEKKEFTTEDVEKEKERLPESPHEVFHHLPNKHQDSTHRVTGTGVTDNTHGEKKGNQNNTHERTSIGETGGEDNTHGEKEGNQNNTHERTSIGETEGDSIVTTDELSKLCPGDTSANSFCPTEIFDVERRLSQANHRLRTRRKKEKVVVPKKSNAERCQEYKTHLKLYRPDVFKEQLASKREYSKAWRASRTQEQKTRDKELSRIRKAKRREQRKLGPAETPVPKPKPKKKKNLTREEKEKKKLANEQARLRMRRFRATWHPDKRKEENEKRSRRCRQLATKTIGESVMPENKESTTEEVDKEKERLPESPQEVFHHLPNKHQDSTHRVTGTGVTDNTHGEKEGNQNNTHERTSIGETEGDSIVTTGELLELCPGDTSANSFCPAEIFDVELSQAIHHLRSRRKKEKVVVPKKSNAERCQEYKTHLKLYRPDVFKEQLASKREYSKAWRASRTQEQKTRDKELSRIRKAKRREQRKLRPAETPVPKPKPKKKKNLTREEKEKKKVTNEEARLRMRRLRATWHPDKRKEENEKRSRRYYETKAKKTEDRRKRKQQTLSLLVPSNLEGLSQEIHPSFNISCMS